MTHTYQLTGLTCDGCVATVKKTLSQIAGIQSVAINEQRNEATITMTQHVSTDTLKAALANHPKYTISDVESVNNNLKSDIQNLKSHTPSRLSRDVPSVKTIINAFDEPEKSWFETYKPLLVVFAYITGIAFLATDYNEGFDGMQFMRFFMAGFFIAFSFFKMLDLTGFADSYSSYDLLAKQWRGYGFIYPFIELALGVAYLIDFHPFTTNVATIIVMGFSTIGVLKSVLNKQKIQCACLGAVFNLPMSTVTIVEDLLMVMMAAAMLFLM